MTTRELIDRYVHTDQRRDARVAAMILRADPDYAGDQEVGEWLRRIGASTIRKETVEGWLEQANVNPWRPVSKMKDHQRAAVAAELDKFAKGAGE